MTDVRICWAYNKDGQRCDHPAGHPGNHVVMTEWTDEECYSPTIPQHVQLPTPNPVQQHMNPPLSTVTAPPANDNCVACNHKHRSGECRCGCKEFIG